MSEFDFEESFTGLDTTFRNPELANVLDEAAVYQSIIDESDESSIEEDDIRDIISQLDKMWPYMGQEITITGNVIMPLQTDPEEPGVLEISSRFVEDKVVQSLGFNVIRMTNTTDDEEYDRLVLSLFFSFEPELASENRMLDSYLIKRGHAEPNRVIITPPSLSEMQLFDQLHYFLPDVAQDIDTAILNADSESAAVMALKSIRVPRFQDRIPTDLELVTNYINRRIDFDKVVPYRMDFDGPCQVINGEGKAMPAYATPGVNIGRTIVGRTCRG